MIKASLLVLALILLQTCVKNEIQNKNTERKQMNDEILEKIKRIDETLANKVQSRKARIEKIDTPFLNDGNIYQISEFTPTRPVVYYLGLSKKQEAFLNQNAESFYSFVKDAGINIDKKELRIEYVKTYLRVVYVPNQRLQILENIDEVKERPNLPEEKRKAFAEFKEKYSSIVKRPECSLTNCILFAIKGQDLVRFDVKLDQEKVEINEEVLEKQLLIPYAI